MVASSRRRPARLGADSRTPRPVSWGGALRREPGARLYPPASRRDPKRGGPDRALGGQQELPDLPDKATAPLAPGPMQDTGQTLAPFTLTVWDEQIDTYASTCWQPVRLAVIREGEGAGSAFSDRGRKTPHAGGTTAARRDPAGGAKSDRSL
jgi:hypothetical protein